jgi:hypothetical protein
MPKKFRQRRGSVTEFKYLIRNKTFFPSATIRQLINGKYVEGFYIYARNVRDGSSGNEPPSYKMLTALNAGSGASTCKISGLQKFTTYEFFIVPFYKAVEGKPSNSRLATTLEDGEFTLITLFCVSLRQTLHKFSFPLSSPLSFVQFRARLRLAWRQSCSTHRRCT